MRLFSALFAVHVAGAPLQCGSRENDVAVLKEERGGDALFQLAERFRNEGDLEAERATLRFLVERYPASRFAPAARERLLEGRDAGSD